MRARSSGRGMPNTPTNNKTTQSNNTKERNKRLTTGKKRKKKRRNSFFEPVGGHTSVSALSSDSVSEAISPPPPLSPFSLGFFFSLSLSLLAAPSHGSFSHSPHAPHYTPPHPTPATLLSFPCSPPWSSFKTEHHAFRAQKKSKVPFFSVGIRQKKEKKQVTTQQHSPPPNQSELKEGRQKKLAGATGIFYFIFQVSPPLPSTPPRPLRLFPTSATSAVMPPLPRSGSLLPPDFVIFSVVSNHFIDARCL